MVMTTTLLTITMINLVMIHTQQAGQHLEVNYQQKLTKYPLLSNKVTKISDYAVSLYKDSLLQTM